MFILSIFAKNNHDKFLNFISLIPGLVMLTPWFCNVNLHPMIHFLIVLNKVNNCNFVKLKKIEEIHIYSNL